MGVKGMTQGLVSTLVHDNAVDAMAVVCYERRKQLGIERKSYAKASKKGEVSCRLKLDISLYIRSIRMR